ncbi:MAG TPA: hypothetical protein VME46_07355, partial [Acidimicrobiales bacterium]|nr:hypothetical protein [Acidimicrobiales bacterium]
IVTVIILFIVFGGGSVAFREYFARHKKKTEAGHDEGEAGEPALAPATAGPAADPAPTGDAPGLPTHGD